MGYTSYTVFFGAEYCTATPSHGCYTPIASPGCVNAWLGPLATCGAGTRCHFFSCPQLTMGIYGDMIGHSRIDFLFLGVFWSALAERGVLMIWCTKRGLFHVSHIVRQTIQTGPLLFPKDQKDIIGLEDACRITFRRNLQGFLHMWQCINLAILDHPENSILSTFCRKYRSM